MTVQIACRCIHAIGLLVAVVVLNFFLLQLAPGDPAQTIAGEMGGITEGMPAKIRADHGLDQSLFSQLGAYLVLPHIRASSLGCIINVTHNMSKFAVMELTHAARRLVWEDGVCATVLGPSFVQTAMTGDVTKAEVTKAEVSKMIGPDDLAELAAAEHRQPC